MLILLTIHENKFYTRTYTQEATYRSARKDVLERMPRNVTHTGLVSLQLVDHLTRQHVIHLKITTSYRQHRTGK